MTSITNAREDMKALPEAKRIKIVEQVEEFRSERVMFDREVSKLDDRGNDVIVLAKHMGMIMMEMTDFTRGRGPLKTTMDVINAAKRISKAGTKLDKLARVIADRCIESTTKKDVIAYLQRNTLYCHQLNITSKVKADVQNLSGELIVSGLDSVTSFIQDAKNQVDRNEFIDASRLVYDRVREGRRAVLMNMGEEEIDTDTEWDKFEDSEVGSNRPAVESRTNSVIDDVINAKRISEAGTKLARAIADRCKT